MSFLASWVKLIVPDKCFDEFFIEFNLLNAACHKLVLSKLLGYTIVFSSLFVKVPQIKKIWSAQSSAGISISSLIFEYAVLVYAVAYGVRGGFPFSTYGELIFFSSQSLVQTSLVIYFSNKSHQLVPFLVVSTLITGILVAPVIPMSIMKTGVALTTLFGLAGKILQVVANYKNSSTGLLSGMTVFMLLFNGIARIYTTLMEIGDVMIVTNYSLVTLVNLVITGQMLYYWNNSNDGGAKSGERGKNSSLDENTNEKRKSKVN